MTDRSEKPVDEFDWSNVDDTTIPELLRQAEGCIDGSLRLGLGADQRATTLCGIFGGGGVAVLAAAAGMLSSSKPQLAFIYAAIVTAGPLLVASYVAAKAGAPIDFFVGGYEPKKLILSASHKKWLMRYTIVDIQRRIDANRAALARSAKLTAWSRRIAAVGIVAGIATFTAFQILPALRPS